MGTRAARESDLETILEISNRAAAHTTAAFDLAPRAPEAQKSWFAEHVDPYPVIVRKERRRVLGWGGSRRSGRLEEVGFMFDRWLDVAVNQRACGS